MDTSSAITGQADEFEEVVMPDSKQLFPIIDVSPYLLDLVRMEQKYLPILKTLHCACAATLLNIGTCENDLVVTYVSTNGNSFVNPGDSGSVIFDGNTNEALGLLFGCQLDANGCAEMASFMPLLDIMQHCDDKYGTKLELAD